MERVRRNIVTGVLVSLPLMLTVWLLSFVFDLFVRLGRPVLRALGLDVYLEAPGLGFIPVSEALEQILAALIVVILLYLLGTLANAMIGRRLIALFDSVMARIPLVEMVYGAVRQFIKSMSSSPGGGDQKRVVLIEFPTPEMRAIGLVTRVFTAVDTGEEIAAVYVPTTPNPTSGYMELVPVSRLTWLDWTTNEAMQFIVSGGTVAPETIHYGRPGDARAVAVPQAPPGDTGT